MGSLRHERAARACVWTACAAGVVHALFSLYWALGGSWLLDTVGAALAGHSWLWDPLFLLWGLALLGYLLLSKHAPAGFGLGPSADASSPGPPKNQG